jgi:hypothetical protein
MRRALAAAGLALGAATDCDAHDSCEACASASSWLGGCRWCPLAGDSSCHAYGSPENACGSSQEVTNASACAALYEPTQVHFAFAGGDGLSVSWTTRGNATQRAAYGAAGARLDAVVDATTVAYLESFQHTAVVKQLAPSTTYDVRVGAESAWSDVFNITTARAAGDLAAPVRAAVFGDLGRRQYGGAATMDGLAGVADTVDFFWHLAGQQKRAKFPTSEGPISAVVHSFRLTFGRAIISRNGIEAWMLFPERARAEHSR